jgi:hypothetical protein
MRRGFLLVPLLAVGCATHADRLKEIRTAYYSGDTKMAAAQIDAAIDKHAREADVLKLDKATTLLGEGRAAEAEALFREVRDRFEEKEGKDVREGVAAMLVDDQQLAYPGEDYEKVLVRFYLALCNLMRDGSDAPAYALQVNEKQQQLVAAGAGRGPDGKNLKESYKLVAAGAYLHAALREETHANYDDVARSLQQVATWQPDFRPAKADLERAKTGRHSQPGHGVVYVFAMVGRGPFKEEKAEPVSSVSLLLADRLISALGKQSLPPTLAPVKIPHVSRPVNEVSAVAVGLGGHPAGRTETLTDVGLMASQQADAVMPETLARAVVRRVVKKGVIYGVKEAVKTDQTQWSSLALNAVGVAWEAMESADTRCWGLLPDKIQVLRLELPAGEHSLTLQPTGASGLAIGGPEAVRVPVADGRNTYVLATFPGSRAVGRVVTSRPKP